MPVFVPAQVVVVRLDVAGRHRLDRASLRLEQGQVERLHHLLRDVRLDPKNLVEGLVIDLRPAMGAVRRADQLGSYAHAGRTLGRFLPADAPLQDVVDPELSADFGKRLLRALVGVSARAAEDPQVADRGQPGGDLFRYPVREILLPSGAQIRKGEHHDPLRCPRGLRTASAERFPDEEPANREEPAHDHREQNGNLPPSRSWGWRGGHRARAPRRRAGLCRPRLTDRRPVGCRRRACHERTTRSDSRDQPLGR